MQFPCKELAISKASEQNVKKSYSRSQEEEGIFLHSFHLKLYMPQYQSELKKNKSERIEK